MRRPGIVLVATLTCIAGISVALPPGPRWNPGFPLRTSDTTVLLTWTPVPGTSEYVVSRAKDGEGLLEIYRGAPNVYHDDDAPSSAEFTYSVTAMLGGERTEPSPPARLAADAAPNPPGIIGSISRAGSIRLRWTTVPGAAYYNVYRAEGETGPEALLGPSGFEGHADVGVEPGKVYRYRVSAVGRTGRESARSGPYVARSDGKSPGAGAAGSRMRKALSWKRNRDQERHRFDQPAAIVADHHGDLHVLERGGIQVLGPNGEFRAGIRFPNGWGRASGLAPDRDNTVAVAFFSDGLVRVVDNTGELVRELRYPPCANGAANSPVDVAIDGVGDYWIVDGNCAQVIRYARLTDTAEIFGRPRGSYTRDDMAASDFPSAKNIRFNPHDGKIYVTLSLLAEVRVIDPATSGVTRSFGGFGRGEDQFQSIGGLGFRKNGNVLLFDHLMQSVKEFSSDYRHLSTQGDVEHDGTVRLSTNFASAFAFAEQSRRLYVLSVLGNRLYVFDAVD